MSITTVARVKALMGIPAGVTYHDDAIAQAVEVANAYVLEAIGQPSGLAVHTRVEYLCASSPGQRYVMLQRSPVAMVVALTHEGSPLGPEDYYTDEVGALHVRPGGRVANWSTEPGSIEITYLHGYTDATLPGDLRGAADMIAAHIHGRGSHAGTTEQSLGTGGLRVVVDAAAIPTTAAEILHSYRHRAY